MKKKDHLKIGRLLLEQKGVRVGGLKRMAFLFGCVEPDINPFTYTRGSIKHEFMHGHHADNSRRHRHKLIRKLSKSGVHSLWQWFSFGTLIHYAVDSFTFAHNSIFNGSIAEHLHYENQLHAAFGDYLRDKAAKHRHLFDRISDMDALHDRYISGAGKTATDCRYILGSTKWLWHKMTPGVKKLAHAGHAH